MVDNSYHIKCCKSCANAKLSQPKECFECYADETPTAVPLLHCCEKYVPNATATMTPCIPTATCEFCRHAFANVGIFNVSYACRRPIFRWLFPREVKATDTCDAFSLMQLYARKKNQMTRG